MFFSAKNGGRGRWGELRRGILSGRYHHLYTSDSGESRWRDVQVDLVEHSFAPPAKNIEISEPFPARAMLFLRLKAGWNEPIHPTPIGQSLICLRGAVRVTASNIKSVTIGPGDVWRMEDVGGRGVSYRRHQR